MSGNIRQISFNTRELLDGETWERYDDAHRVLAAILTGLRNAGFRRNEALHFLRDHEGEGVRRLREHYKGKFDSQVMSKWAAVERKDSRHQQEVDAWLKFINQVFDIPRGGNVFRVAIALAEVARTAGSLTFTASERQIAERAAVGTATERSADAKTVRRALKRLVERGWITSKVSDHSSGTMQYTLQSNKNPITPPQVKGSNRLANRPSDSEFDGDSRNLVETGTIESSRPYVVGKFDPSEALSELFSHAGIGFNSFRVLTLIRTRNGVRMKDIVQLLGMSKQSVSNALSRLSKHRMILRGTAGEWFDTGRSVTDVVSELGLADRAGYRALGFKHQRESFERYQRYREGLRDSLSAYAERPPSSF